MRVAVLGAGPAGLAAAWRLVQDGHEVDVFEREGRVGGQSATTESDGFRLDYGPHAYHVRGTRVDALYREMLGHRDAPQRIDQQVLLHGKRFHYPFRFAEVIRGLPVRLTARVLADYARVSLAGCFRKRPVDTFEAWGVKRFGRTLYELCFGQYTERVWGMPPSQISAGLASQKLARLSLRDIILKLLGGRGEKQSTYWIDFFYPERGSGVLFEALREAVTQAGGSVHLSAPVRRVRVSEGQGAEIRADGPNGPLDVRADWVISTIPVGALAKAIDPPLDAAVRQAADRLRFRSLMLVNLALDIPQAMPQHWVYLLDPRFRFNRVAEQKNLGRLCAPANRTALAFELCCNEGDEVWRSPDEALYEAAIAEARKTGLFPDTPMKGLCVLRLAEAYPVYDLELDRNLGAVVGALRGIPNLVSLGREGLFLNCDIHDAMLMGLEGAEFAMGSPALPAVWYDRMAAFVAERTGRGHVGPKG